MADHGIRAIEPGGLAPGFWVHFYRPQGWVGRLVSKITKSEHSHVDIEIGPGAILQVPLYGPPRWVPAASIHGDRPPSRTYWVPLGTPVGRHDCDRLVRGVRYRPLRSFIRWLMGGDMRSFGTCLLPVSLMAPNRLWYFLGSVRSADDLILSLEAAGYAPTWTKTKDRRMARDTTRPLREAG